MTKNRLNTLALILISMLAVACGDAGNDDAGFKDEGGTAGVDGGEGGQGGEGGHGGEPAPDPEAFCGDGFLDATNSATTATNRTAMAAAVSVKKRSSGPSKPKGRSRSTS